jgi:hypothetical protein
MNWTGPYTTPRCATVGPRRSEWCIGSPRDHSGSYTPLKAVLSPRAAHPSAHAFALIFGLWTRPIVWFLKQMTASFLIFNFFFFFFSFFTFSFLLYFLFSFEFCSNFKICLDFEICSDFKIYLKLKFVQNSKNWSN